MELGLSNDSGGQFFTPYNVCQMMAEMTIGNVVPQVKERGYITINDPACGAGATLIAGVHAAAKQLMKAGFNWQNHILVTAQDIDYTVAADVLYPAFAARCGSLYQGRKYLYRAHVLKRYPGELLDHTHVLLRGMDNQTAFQGQDALISKYI